MLKNDFAMNTKFQDKKEELRKIKVVIIFTIILTGIFSLSGIMFMVIGIINSIWEQIGMAAFVQQFILFLSIQCVFVSLIKMQWDSKPFSRILTRCIRFIGGTFTISSFVVPRLSGYVSSGFELFSINSFVLLDGVLLTFGLLFIILSALIKIAFEMQNEMDEVL